MDRGRERDTGVEEREIDGYRRKEIEKLKNYGRYYANSFIEYKTIRETICIKTCCLSLSLSPYLFLHHSFFFLQSTRLQLCLTIASQPIVNRVPTGP